MLEGNRKFLVFTPLLLQLCSGFYAQAAFARTGVSPLQICSEIIRGLKRNAQVDSGYRIVSVKINGEAPSVHAGNYEETTNYIGRSTSLRRSPFLRIGSSVQLPEEENALLIDKISADGKFVVMRGLLGVKRCFTINLAWDLKVTFTERVKADCPIAGAEVDVRGIQAPLRNFDFRRITAEELAAAQERASLSAKENVFKRTHRQSTVAANRLSLQVLFSGREILREDLEKINFEVNRNVTKGSFKFDTQKNRSTFAARTRTGCKHENYLFRRSQLLSER